MRRTLHNWLEKHFQSGPEGAADAGVLGVEPALDFEVHSARFAYRVSPDGTVKPQLLLGILQEVEVPANESDPTGEKIRIEGGCTIVADLRSTSIGYCIRKAIRSSSRIERTRSYFTEASEDPRAAYFGPASVDGAKEPFAALHRCH